MGLGDYQIHRSFNLNLVPLFQRVQQRLTVGSLAQVWVFVLFPTVVLQALHKLLEKVVADIAKWVPVLRCFCPVINHNYPT